MHPDKTAPLGTKYRSRGLLIAGILMASVVLVAATSFYYGEQNEITIPIEQTKGQKTIAVLPFVNLSNDPQNEFFADGLTDTLIHRLSQLNELKVTARTSAFSFKHSTESIESIAGQLGVGNILDGSVQRIATSVTTAMQLQLLGQSR